MRPYSQKQPFQVRDVMIQGASVRQIWGIDEPAAEKERKPLRRDPPPRPAGLKLTEDTLRLRLAEELEYTRRVLNGLEDVLANDPVLVVRHALPLQSLDIVSQVLGHLASVIRSDDQHAAINRVGMAELKARLMRRSIG